MELDFRKMLIDRKNYLRSIIAKKERDVEKAPKGLLRVNQRKNQVQYYHRMDKTDINGKYIKKKQFKLAKKLAQKRYDESLLISAQKEYNLLMKMEQKYEQLELPEDVFYHFPNNIKNMIWPINPNPEDIVYQWLESVKDEPRLVVNSSDYISDRGEKMRSKSELLIANALNRANIPYVYEKVIYLKNGKKVAPDFTIFDRRTMKEIYWEHFGRMDDRDYIDKNIPKLSDYIELGFIIGFNLLATFETYKYPIRTGVIQKMINHLLTNYEVALNPEVVW